MGIDDVPFVGRDRDRRLKPDCTQKAPRHLYILTCRAGRDEALAIVVACADNPLEQRHSNDEFPVARDLFLVSLSYFQRHILTRPC